MVGTRVGSSGGGRVVGISVGGNTVVGGGGGGVVGRVGGSLGM